MTALKKDFSRKALIHHEYLIENIVHFLTKEAILRPISNQELIKLHRPASRCLELLIARRGELVTQNELIAYAWGEKRGQFVSVNTFYQTMYHLRHSLQQAGCQDIIYTVPRQGTGILDNITILEVAVPDGKRTLLEVFRFALLSNRALHISFLTLLAVVGCILFLIPVTSNFPAFSEYRNTDYQGCKVFSDNSHITAEIISQLLFKVGLDCKGYHAIYINASQIHPRTSLLVCKKESSCRTVIIMRDNND